MIDQTDKRTVDIEEFLREKQRATKQIVVKTTYYNCTDEFVDEYINSLCSNPYFKEAKREFLDGKTIQFKSGDDQSPAYGITEYTLRNPS